MPFQQSHHRLWAIALQRLRMRRLRSDYTVNSFPDTTTCPPPRGSTPNGAFLGGPPKFRVKMSRLRQAVDDAHLTNCITITWGYCFPLPGDGDFFNPQIRVGPIHSRLMRATLIGREAPLA